MRKQLVLLAVVIAAAGSCAHVGYAHIGRMSGAPGAAQLGVAVVDPRTGSGYAGLLTLVETGSGPVGTLPLPGLVSGDATGINLDVAWPKKVP